MNCKYLVSCTVFIITVHLSIGEKHKVKHRVTKLSEQVRLIIDHYKASDPEGLPVVNIPDPVRIPDKNRRLGLGVNLILHDTFVYGLSKCKIKATDMDFGKLEMYVAVQVEKLEVLGNYTLEAFYGISRTKGSCNITFYEVFSEGILNLCVARNGYLEAQEVELNVIVDKFIVDFKRTNVIEQALNRIGPIVLEIIKPLLLKVVNINIRGDMNKKFQSLKQTFPNSIPPIDLAIAKGRKFVREQGYDPYRIQDTSYGNGIFQAEINEIWVTGLSTFYRTGNVTVTMENNTFYIGFDMGAQKVGGTCNWKISVANFVSQTGSMEFSIDYFETSVKINQSVDIRNKPQVEDIQLKLGNIQMHMNGMGTLDYIVEFLVNFFPNLLRYQIMNSIKGPLKIKAEEIIDNTDFEKVIEEHLPYLDILVSENFTSALVNNSILGQQEIEEEGGEIFVEEGLTVDKSKLDDEIF